MERAWPRQCDRSGYPWWRLGRSVSNRTARDLLRPAGTGCGRRRTGPCYPGHPGHCLRSWPAGPLMA